MGICTVTFEAKGALVVVMFWLCEFFLKEKNVDSSMGCRRTSQSRRSEENNVSERGFQT